MNAVAKEFLRAARIEGLLAEPPAAPCSRLARPEDEAAFLFDVLERGVDRHVFDLVEERDFTVPVARAVFAYMRDSGEEVIDIDRLLVKLAERYDTDAAVIRRGVAPIIERPSAFHTTVEEKARGLHALGRLRRLFDFVARWEAGVCVAATRGSDFDAPRELDGFLAAFADQVENDR